MKAFLALQKIPALDRNVVIVTRFSITWLVEGDILCPFEHES